MDSPDSSLKGVTTYLLRRDHKMISLHLIFAFFVSLSFLLTLHRNPWRDEAQAWLMARDLSPLGLFWDARHDGHPILWHLCLQVIQALGMNYLGMMIFNWALMAVAVWLLFYRSTVPFIARITLALCPACLLGISCTARNYAISATMIFIAATLYPRAQKKPILYSTVLALLASTNIYATAVFVGIGFQFLLEQALGFGRDPFSLRPLYTRYLISNLILLLGALLLVAQLYPTPLPGDLPDQAPTYQIHLTSLNPQAAFIFLGAAALIFFSKSPGFPRIVGGVVAGSLALFPTLLYHCQPRHSFMIVLGIVYFVWIYLDDILAKNAPSKHNRILVQLALLIVAASIICQPYGLKGAFKHYFDSKHTAQAIIDNHLDEPTTLMVTTNPNKTTGILMLLKNIRTNYGPPPYPPTPMSFADYHYTQLRAEGVIPSIEEIKPLVLKLAADNPSKTIMVVSDEPSNAALVANDPDYHLVPIYASPDEPGQPLLRELFQVYILKR